MVWGPSSSARTCDSLLERIERNDPTLQQLVVLPLKKFGPSDLRRIAECIRQGKNTSLTTLQASGHSLSNNNDSSDNKYDNLQHVAELFGSAISSRGSSNTLVDISIGDSNFGDDGVVAFCRGLKSSGGSSSSSSSSSSPDDGTEISIQKLDLSYKGMGGDGLTSLIDVMGRQRSLQYLDLSRNERLNEMDLYTWVKQKQQQQQQQQAEENNLPLFPCLKNLDLSHCGLDARSCLGWLMALHDDKDPRAEQVDLIVIKLNGNNAGRTRTERIKSQQQQLESNNETDDFFEIFVKHFAYKSSRYVQELHMSKCSLGDEELNVISKCWFSAFTTTATDETAKTQQVIPDDFECMTQELVLDQNNFTGAGLSLLADNLLHQMTLFNQNDHQMNPMLLFLNLQKLNLSGNNLDDESCSKLAAAISESKKKKVGPFQNLQELDLSKTNCGVNAAVKLIDDCRLTNLNLFGNALGSDGFLKISKVLKGGHPTLATLDVGGNDASEEGIVALLKGLLFSPNPSSSGSDGEVEDTNKTKNTLKLLVVGGNKSGPTVESMVEEINKIHPHLDIARDKPKRSQDASGAF